MAALRHLLLIAKGTVKDDAMLEAVSVGLYALGTVCGVLLGAFFWKLVYRH